MAELCQNKRKIFFDVSDHSNRYAKLLKWNECKVVPTCIKKKPCNTNLSYFKVPQRLRLWSFRYIQIFSLSKLTLFFLFSMFGHKPIGMLSHFSCFTHFINHLFFSRKKTHKMHHIQSKNYIKRNWIFKFLSKEYDKNQSAKYTHSNVRRCCSWGVGGANDLGGDTRVVFVCCFPGEGLNFQGSSSSSRVSERERSKKLSWKSPIPLSGIFVSFRHIGQGKCPGFSPGWRLT